jgi:nucleotide-binding universal stress UspA family protein
VVQRVSGFAPGEFDACYRRLVERSERKLRQITRKFAEGGFDVRTAVRVGEPAAEIVRAMQRERVDLVVMGSHKVRHWPRASSGSSAQPTYIQARHEREGGE